MKLVTLECPKCGGELKDVKVEEGTDTLFCTYCGARVAIDKDNEFVFRHIDEARIREAEAAEESNKSFAITSIVALVVFGLIMIAPLIFMLLFASCTRMQ